LILGSIGLFLNTILLLLGERVEWPVFIFIIFVIIIGVTMLTRPYFVVGRDSLSLKNFPWKKTYYLDEGENLQLVGNRIYLMGNGIKKKIRISRHLANNRDWIDFSNYVKSW
jgi:drug/metabolite transporter (DMT)-like permease